MHDKYGKHKVKASSPDRNLSKKHLEEKFGARVAPAAKGGLKRLAKAVYDRNGDGLINNGGELFGNYTVKYDGTGLAANAFPSCKPAGLPP